MDNFFIDIVCEHKDNLRRAIDIVFTQHRRATHYAIRPAEPDEEVGGDPRNRTRPKPLRLVLFWSKPTGNGGEADVLPLPFTLDAEGATNFIESWLKEAD